MSGRSDHCPDFLYDEAQHARNTATGKPPNFLWLDASVENTANGRAYIASGEHETCISGTSAASASRGTRCRPYTPRKSECSSGATTHRASFSITSGAYTTDTAYRIRALRRTAEGLVYGFFNSLTPSARNWKDGTTAAAFWNWCLPRKRKALIARTRRYRARCGTAGPHDP